MIHTKRWLSRVLFGSLAVALLGVALSACRAHASCDMCGRDECTALAFRVEYRDGGTQTTCCPRCGSHAVAEAHGREVTRLRARDFDTGQEIDAKTATYVEGSDVEHCVAPKEQPSAQSCCRVLTYDRCLPSLIAFGSTADAERFVGDHGGTLMKFDDLAFGK